MILGPGFDVAQYRDLDPVMVDSMLGECPALVVADFSRKILQDARSSLAGASKELSSKIHLARREFSGGISPRFEEFMSPRIDRIENAAQMAAFIDELNAIPGDDLLLRIMEQHIEPSRGEPGVIHDPMSSPDRYYDFQSVTGIESKVRFITCNLLVAGMLATTEGAFREKLMAIHEREPSIVTRDTVIDHLRDWHSVVAHMNSEIAANLLGKVLEQNPEATISLVTDETTSYKRYEKHKRWDLDKVRRLLLGRGIRLVQHADWQQDDSDEVPSHTHGTSHFIVEFKPKNGSGSGDSGTNLPRVVIPANALTEEAPEAPEVPEEVTLERAQDADEAAIVDTSTSLPEKPSLEDESPESAQETRAAEVVPDGGGRK